MVFCCSTFLTNDSYPVPSYGLGNPPQKIPRVRKPQLLDAGPYWTPGGWFMPILCLENICCSGELYVGDSPIQNASCMCERSCDQGKLSALLRFVICERSKLSSCDLWALLRPRKGADRGPTKSDRAVSIHGHDWRYGLVVWKIWWNI